MTTWRWKGWVLKGRFHNTCAPKVHHLLSGVNNSKSLAMPGKSVSMLLKGPMVMKGASFPVSGSQYGAAWFRRMTISGNSSLPNCMPLGIIRHPLWLALTYSCTLGSPTWVAGILSDPSPWMWLGGCPDSWMSSQQGLSYWWNPMDIPCKMEDQWHKPSAHHSCQWSYSMSYVEDWMTMLSWTPACCRHMKLT